MGVAQKKKKPGTKKRYAAIVTMVCHVHLIRNGGTETELIVLLTLLISYWSFSIITVHSVI